MEYDTDKVEQACSDISRRLASFRADAARVEDLRQCLVALDWLRQQYRCRQAVVAPYLDRIKELSGQVRQAMAESRESLTAKYLEAVSAVAAWEEMREACRDVLLELANAENVQCLTSPRGSVEIKHSQIALLPKTGTAQREELLAVITQAQRWPDVAYPSPARLSRALEGNLFTPEQAAQVTRLCPIQTVYRLAAHHNGDRSL
ncbi:MAG: hypothetical protein EHM48_07500 [Planctomycetaceae bacterium]|nr:MAG: hypothetical protein EHM48_07500 [Planctomycetaceae bacterium]